MDEDRSIGVTEARLTISLQHLEKVELLRRDAQGWTPLVSNTLTARGVPSRAVKNFHRGMMERATRALFQQSIDRREFSSLIVSFDPRRIPELKERL